MERLKEKSMKGHILIRDKVCFVPEGLEKPKEGDYPKYQERYSDTAQDTVLNLLSYKEALKAYEASKKTVEVENVYKADYTMTWRYTNLHSVNGVKNNTYCEAEVNETATIIKLL